MKRLYPALVAASLLLLAGCGSSSSGGGGGGTLQPEPEPEPEVSIEQTGIYRGSVETEAGDIALMVLLLARSGETAIGFETDDSQRPTIILHGAASEAAGAIGFEGSDTRDGSEVAIDIDFDDDLANGTVALEGLAGEFRLQRDALGDRAASLADLAGDYGREDSALGSSRLTIAEDGAVSYSGACAASGTVASGDPAVNLYQLSLEGDCIALDVLLTREDLAAEGDVLWLLGSDGDRGISTYFYRL